MFCPQCGNDMKEGHKFCAKCGAPAPKLDDTAKQAQTPKPPAPKPANKVDVKNIIKSPPKVMVLEETVDFKHAEHALEHEKLKVNAFSGLFSSPQSTEIRVESLTKVYEPIHMVRAVYEGTFEVAKDFNFALDPDSVKIKLEGKTYDVTPVAKGGMFGGGSPSLKLTGTEIVKKRVEKGVYYDMNGVQKANLEMLVKGKDTNHFDTGKKAGRTQVLKGKFDASHLADKVLTPDIVRRQTNAKKTVDEKITVDIQTIYYPKYKALVKNLRNNRQKYLILSAVDKQLLPSETF